MRYLEHALAIFGAFSLFALIGLAAMLARSTEWSMEQWRRSREGED